MDIKAQSDDELREQAGYWSEQMDRYSHANYQRSYDRARRYLHQVEAELIERNIDSTLSINP